MGDLSYRWLIVLVLCAFLAYFLYQVSKGKGRYHVAIRDAGPDSSYSLEKSQLLWWTIIIIVCFTISFAHTGIAKNVLNSSCLILLGISLGTTTAGKLIDNREENNPAIVRHQDLRKQHSYWTDILSDGGGISLHRFQSVIFNLLFGLIFVVQFFDDGMTQLPDYDTTTLGLIGLSSGGFIALKVNENGTSNRNIVAQTPIDNTPETPADTKSDKPAS